MQFTNKIAYLTHVCYQVKIHDFNMKIILENGSKMNIMTEVLQINIIYMYY